MHLLTLAQTTLAQGTTGPGGWFHDLSPFAVRFTSTFGLRWYGLSYALGFLVGFFMLRMLAKRNATEIPLARIGDAMMYLIVGVLVGGRLFYVIGYEPHLLTDFTSAPPWWGVLAINRGGMASHGGIIGVALACWRISRGFKTETGRIEGRTSPICTLDTAALIAPFGLFFGRIANFINGELLGAIVANPGQHAPWWAIRYPQEITAFNFGEHGEIPDQLAQTPQQLDKIIDLSMNHMLPNDQYWESGYHRMLDLIQHGDTVLKAQLEPLIAARYPSQIFQACLDGLLVMAVVWIIAAKPRKPGIVAGAFAIVYALGRIPMDLIRLPDAGVAQFGFMTRGQAYSAATLLAGIAVVVYALRTKRPKHGGWLKSCEH